jgi:hypothetical protein
MTTEEIVRPTRKTKNFLTFQQKYRLAKWMNKHLEWCKSKGMSSAEMVAKANSELGFPLTTANARHLWVKEMENAWPFTYERASANGSPGVLALAAQTRLLARELVRLYGIMGDEQEADPEIRAIAGISITEGGTDYVH